MPTVAAAVARRAASSTSASRALSRVRSASRKLLKPALSASTRCLAATVRSTLRAEASFRRTASTSGSAYCPMYAFMARDDPPDPGELDGLISREPLERPCAGRQRGARLVRRLEEALVPCDDEAAQPGLEVDELLLERVGGHERLARLTPQIGRPAQLGDREQHDGERPAHDHREETARDDHSASQPASHVHVLWRRR